MESLSPQQLAHFNTFGFVHLRALFTPEEVETLSAEMATAHATAESRDPFDEGVTKSVRMLSDSTPFFQGLGEDPRFLGAARQMYGDDVFYHGCDANRWAGDTAWHCDHHIDPALDCFGVKLCVYLDSLTEDTGALRLVVGSHRDPLHTELRAMREENGGALPEGLPCHVCETTPGDVVAFDMRASQ